MSAYRLETFQPASGPTAVKIGPLERRIEAAREEAYHDGYLAGQAAATDGFLEEQGRLTSELIEAINDARVTNEAARRHVAASARADGRGARCRGVSRARRRRARGRDRRRGGTRAGPCPRGAAAAPLRARACRPH